MNKYGLIGKRLGHSLSQQLFLEQFPEGEYGLYELDGLDRVRSLGLDGFNVTIPYKVNILPLLDALDAEAEAIGAVNCVALEEGRWVGHNTDWRAFAATLQPLLQPWHKQALILGRGGAARAVAFALNRMGISFRMVGREPFAPQGETLVVNCTPVGMTPLAALTPLADSHWLSPQCLCYDLVYNPERTRFLLEAEQCGALTMNGLPMLRRQAELSWELWGLK